MSLAIYLAFISISFAGFRDVDQDDLYKYTKTKSKKRVIRGKKRDALDDLVNKLMGSDQKLYDLIKRSERKLIIRSKQNKVISLTRIKGTLLNSVLAMNVRPSTYVVKIDDDHELIGGGELRCLGVSFQKRVLSKCNLLVFRDLEYPVNISIWDLDGAEGMMSDYFYDGAEKSFLSSSFASFLEGAIDGAKDRLITPFGQTSVTNSKNQVLSGLTSVFDNVSNKISESDESNLKVSYVNAGKEVIIFFNESLTLKARQ
jgi:hypothetical protein